MQHFSNTPHTASSANILVLLQPVFLLLLLLLFTPALAAVALPRRVAIVTTSSLAHEVGLIDLDGRLLQPAAREHPCTTTR